MKLLSSPTSPYARKARVLIIELGLESTIEIENVVPMENPADLHASNPLGKVPALILADGTALYDSPVICEYIDAQHGNKFLSTSGDARWDCLCRQALNDGVIDASFNRTMERLKPAEQQSELWLGRWQAAIARSLNEMEKDIAGKGDRFDLGDVTAAAALGYLDLRHSDLNWRDGHDDLAAWFEGVSKRPSLAATVPG